MQSKYINSSRIDPNWRETGLKYRVTDILYFRFVRGVNRTVNAYVYRVFSKQRYFNQYSRRVKRRRHARRRYRYRRSHKWRRSRSREKRDCRSCGLLLIADNSFYRGVGERSVKGTVMQMLYHVRELNMILRCLFIIINIS